MKHKSTELEFDQVLFQSEEACVELLYQSKWPNGFSCPRCNHKEAYLTKTRKLPLYECKYCRHQTSLTAGTIFEGSKTPLTKWFTAIALVASEDSTSAVALQRTIHVTYKTAWLLLQKIRYAISQADDSTLLSGIVHIGAAVYGRPHNSSLLAHVQEHPFLVGSGTAEEELSESNYVKMKLIPKKHMQQKVVSRAGTEAFIKQSVLPCISDIRIVVDRYSSQRFLPLQTHASKASKWINKTFHGLGRKHLQAYLDEYCYRINQNPSINNTKGLFDHLLQTCASSIRMTYSVIVQMFRFAK